MGTLRRRHVGFATVALTFLLTSISPSGAQEAPGPDPDDLERAASDAGTAGLSATRRIQGDKAPSSNLAETDPALLDRDDAASTRVMIKLDYDSVAAYQGGVDGLAATSPQVTGDPLTGRSSAERAYEAHIDDERTEIVAGIRAAVPQVRIGQAFETVYGGVSAVVPANQVDALLRVDGVVAVQQNDLEQPLTDASPEFLGAPALYRQLGVNARNAGKGVIFGDIDTGVWPEHPSFADQGNLPAPPPRPGGGARECNYGDNPLTPAVDVFACQDKLIGGAHLTDDYDAFVGDDPLPGVARDGNGHGTHTSSTAAGNRVADAPVLGTDRGPIAGLAPGAWVMAYKVCGPQGCLDSDSTRAVEQAILDGVDVINFSISGGTTPYSDPVELAFLDAYAAGVFVSASAGNEGPGAGTANHLSPWTTSVAASTQTRERATTLTLQAAGGDTFTSDGASITRGIAGPLPVVLSSAAPYSDALCADPAPPGTFTGRIVACERGEVARALKGFNVLQGGAAGMILYNPTLADIETDNHWLPTVHLADGTDFLAFMGGHTGVTASFPDAEEREGPADVLAAFSSRGPAGGFVKPDVTAPGVQILAGNTPFPGNPADGAGPPGELYQAIAGTSMAAPHVAGAGALLAALHPEWSPGQIRSALMTTATTDLVKEDLTTPADPFDMGSGRIDLNVAGTAPLTFDETADRFFALGADPAHAVDLNIPSINAPVMPGRLTTTRTATNTSGRRQRFDVTTTAPDGATLRVTPRRFTLAAGESITFNVTIEAPVPGPQQFGRIDIAAARGGDTRLPVAWVPTQAGVTLTQSCAPNPIPHRGTSACTVAAANDSTADTVVDLRTEVSGPLRVAGTDGADWTGNRHAQKLNVPLAGRRPGVPAVGPGSLAGYIPLDALGVTPIPIGDEEIINFTAPAFEYAGQTWDRFGIDSNGYIVVGGGSSADNNCCNLPTGPDPAAPNNILAPFWTDLDGTGAPGIFADVLTDGVSQWIVVEYRVNVFGTGDLQTFQVWIGINGTEDITYAYDPANLPGDPNGQDFLVGAENVLGQGDMEAVLPAGDLRVTSSDPEPGDTVSYTVFVRGRSVGTGTVTSSMIADGVAGTTVVDDDIEVLRRRPRPGG
jgi:subtilisin family serine protease